MQLNIVSEVVGKWHENSYMINIDGEAWLIDPGDNFSVLDASFNLNKLNAKGILCTHAHFDHVGAVSFFMDKYELPFYLHPADKKILRQANLYRKLAGSTDFFDIPKVIHYLDNQLIFKIGTREILIHHTPGHSEGSVSFEIENNLFSGDIIFKNVLGRVDLPGGNIELLRNSVRFILTNFKDYTIYPGHGDPFVLTQDVINNLNKLI